jgi:CheY-like chemotaxis protein
VLTHGGHCAFTHRGYLHHGIQNAVIKALAYLVNEEHACENLVAIFLDLQLPTLTGLQLLRGIRSLERISHLPVFLMTSSNDPKEFEHCRLLGISGFVPKPVTFATFTNAVASTFHKRP